MVNGGKLIEIGGNEIMKRYFFLVVLVLLAYVAPIAVTQAAGPGPVDQAKLQQIKPGGHHGAAGPFPSKGADER